MKKFFLLSLVLLVLGAEIHAQRFDGSQSPRELVRDAKNQGLRFENPGELFSEVPATAGKQSLISNSLTKGTLLRLQPAAVQNLLSQPVDAMEISLQAEGISAELELVRVNLFGPDFKVRSSAHPEGENVSLGLHYRGQIKDVPGSIASFSVFDGEIVAMFSSPDGGNYVLGRLKGSSAAESVHVLYNDADLSSPLPFACETPDDGYVYAPEEVGPRSGGRANECVEIYLEADDNITSAQGGVQGATNFLTGAFNQVATIYSGENLNYSLSDLFIWSSNSPYKGQSASTYLSRFQSNTSSIDGDLGILVSAVNAGGIAAGFNGFCNNNVDASLCFAGIDNFYNNVPTFSWTVFVMTHELGHLSGSRHTHACVWNGNGTAIDGCYTTEGTCARPGLPSNGGTIMSYCYLQSVGVNFNLGFGNQPGNVIRNAASGQNCLDCNGGGGNNGGGGCTGGLASYPYYEGFESGLGIWSNQTGDDFDWVRNSGSTPTSGTGPSSAYSGSWYLYAPAAGNTNGQSAVLESGCFDLNAFGSATLEFYYYMDGDRQMGTLDVEASSDDGASWTSVFSKSGRAGARWKRARVALDAFAGNGVQIRFTATTTNTAQGDIAIDALSLDASGAAAIVPGGRRLQGLAAQAGQFTDRINLYPNPAQDLVQVQIPVLDKGAGLIRISDAMGRSVQVHKVSLSAGQNEYQLNTQDLKAGVYFVEVIQNGKRQVRRLMIK